MSEESFEEAVVAEPTPAQTTQAVALRPAAPMTSEQAKIQAVADLTHAAYSRASQLALTPDEQKALQADFPDEAFKPGAAGKENLIYVEHAFLRDRFNQVFGPGQWAIIPRSRWSEEYTTDKNKEAVRVYVEAMFLIRGCFVAEAVGDMSYYPNNASQNYGDAVEGAKTAALRRCAKELGVGLQAWKKDWCEGWWKRRNGAGRSGGGSTPTSPPQSSAGAKPATLSPATAAQPTATEAPVIVELRKKLGPALASFVWFLRHYDSGNGNPVLAEPRTFEQLSPAWAKKFLGDWDETIGKLDAFLIANPMPEGGNVSTPVEVPRDPETATPDAWRAFLMPWGEKKGIPLADLDKKYLFGLWANYKVTTEYKGNPKSQESIAADTKFREHLNAAGQHYGFK